MPRLRNVTTDEVLVDHLEHADSWWTRFRGLMLRRSLPGGYGLLIQPCSSIHMMWMLFPIDAIWLDEDLQVTKVSPRVPPWVGMARGARGTRMVVELGASRAHAVEVGHQLAIEPDPVD
jgi:uncharacterized membrane protein (UPF0127 family)